MIERVVRSLMAMMSQSRDPGVVCSLAFYFCLIVFKISKCYRVKLMKRQKHKLLIFCNQSLNFLQKPTKYPTGCLREPEL